MHSFSFTALFVLAGCLSLPPTTATYAQQSTRGSLYLEPELNWQQPLLSAPAGVLLAGQERGGQRLRAGLLLRWQPSGRFDYSIGAVQGLVRAGYQLVVPAERLVGGLTGYASGASFSAGVWHFPLRVGYQVAEWQLGGTAAPPTTLRLVLSGGPQFDYRPADQRHIGLPPDSDSSLLLSPEQTRGNHIMWRNTPTDSTRWGSSLYLSTQLRYGRYGRERLAISLYGILGLSALRGYQLDYSVNGAAYTARVVARTSALGLTVSVPVRVHPWGTRPLRQ